MGAGQDLQDYFDGIHTFTTTENNFLDDLIDDLNAENFSTAENNVDIANEVTGDLSALELDSGGDDARLLYDRVLETNLDIIRNKSTTVSETLTVGDVFSGFESTHAGTKELAALYSVIYNVPKLFGTGIADALYDGDRARAWFEILYHHSNYNVFGLMNRREAEADMFGLINSGASDQDILMELNTLYNGIAHNGDNIYNTIQARDTYKPFEDKIASLKFHIENLYTQGQSIDYIQFADGTWITTGGTITAKIADGKDNATTKNLIIGGSDADTVNGLGGDDFLYGMAGVDTLNGGDGSDILEGGAGNDIIDGGSGIDDISYRFSTNLITVSVAASSFSVNGGASDGTDTISYVEGIIGTSFADSVAFTGLYTGTLTIDALGQGSGTYDTLDFSALPGGITINSSGAVADTGITLLNFEKFIGGSGSEDISGTNAAEVFEGNGGTDEFHGGGGVDMINGGAGADDLFGDAGNDVFKSNGHASDDYDGGDDLDKLDYSSAGSAISVDIASVTSGTVSSDSVKHIEHIVGTSGNDVFKSAPGVEIVFEGGAGSDTYYLYTEAGGASDMVVIEKAGASGTDNVIVEGFTVENSVIRRSGSGWELIPKKDEEGNPMPTPLPSQKIPSGTENINDTPLSDWPTDDDDNDDDDGFPLPVPGPEDSGSPLILDLGTSGIDLLNRDDHRIYFDLLGTGQAVRTGWAGPEDGLLALPGANGYVDNGSELFGSATADGFGILAAHDGNGDKVINSSDSVFADLRVWIDGNSDGISSASELHTLSSLDITAISLNYVRTYSIEEGNLITHQAEFTIDSVQKTIIDAWFSYDAGQTVNVQDFDFDVRSAFLPELRGHGNLKDLSVALSMDNGNDPASLMAQMQALAEGMDFADAITNWTETTESVDSLLLRWAGVENLSTTNRGSHVNAQHLAFYEEFTGRAFDQSGRSNPLREAGDFVEAVYDYIKTVFTMHIILQAAGADIFENPSYDYYNRSATGDLDLLSGGIDAVKDAAILADEPGEVWSRFAQFIGYTKGLDNLTAGDITALDDAVDATGEPGLDDWQDVVSLMSVSLGSIIDSADDWGSFEVFYENVNGTSGNDTVTDTNPNGFTGNRLRGFEGNDTLDGLDGNDKLIGGSGNDTLIGGSGEDYMLGGTGDDLYHWSSGNDTVSEKDGGGYDELHILASTGLTTSNVADLYRYGDDLILLLTTGSFITIYEYNGASTKIEKIVFDSNSSTIDLAALIEEKYYGSSLPDNIDVSGSSFQTLTVYGYEANDIITVSGSIGKFYGGDGYDTLIGDYLGDFLYGDNHDDYLKGNAGNDTLQGGAGNDLIYGDADNDTITGGTGNDTIYGGDGNDTITQSSATGTSSNIDYIYGGAGTDTISLTNSKDYIWGGTGNDTISTGNGLNYAYGEDGDDTITGGDDNDYIEGGAGADTINAGQYNDTVYGGDDADDIRPGSGNDTVYGGNGNDYIHTSNGLNTSDDVKYLYGEGGDDLFVMANGVDHIWGGTGADTVKAGSGSDFYYYNVGDGHDTYEESGGSADKIKLGAGIVSTDLTLSRVGDNLLIAISATVAANSSITVTNHYANSTNIIETIVFSDNSTMNIIPAITLTTGNDSATGTSAADLFYALAGDDTINAGSGNDEVYGDDGADTLNGQAGNDLLYGGTGADILDGGDNNDSVYGEDGNDTVKGGNNNDTLYGGAGDDTIQGDSGTDTVSYAYVANGVSVNLLAGTATGEGSDTLATIENITGSAYADTLTGNNSVNTITAGDGNDIIKGNQADDIMYGGLGDDEYQYLYGDDEDYVTDDGGYDVLQFLGTTTSENLDFFTENHDSGAVSDDVKVDFNNTTTQEVVVLDQVSTTNTDRKIEVIKFFDGFSLDFTRYGTAQWVQVGNSTTTQDESGAGSARTIIGGTNANTITGSAYADQIHSDTGNDTINGGAGNDWLHGGTGTDTVNGDAGDDMIWGGAGNDTLNGGADIDTVNYQSSAAAVTANLSTGSATGEGTDTLSNLENITGSNYNDTLTGSTGNNVIKGGSGNDTISGGDGADTLYGEDGNDTITGGNGNDLLYGGYGTDSLTGSAGADQYVFEELKAYQAVDTVSDFSTSDGDALHLTNLLSEYDYLTEAITDFVLMQTSGSNTTVSVDKDGAGGIYSFVQIATLTGVTGLTDEAALVTNGNLIVT